MQLFNKQLLAMNISEILLIVNHIILLRGTNLSGRTQSRSTKGGERKHCLLKRATGEVLWYVASFESKAKEIWLVFRNEGLSLSKLMYTAEETKKVTGDGSKIRNIQALCPSTWWH
ncbi:probable inactive protein kinase At3g63330 [Asparagus officinalis]|uniref:probable inactive protein kinase At3g63330 n=1 Tax=Asparagus officinalis TaxID=4686 RepID=UPI00098E2659|nr:probable inactive protein kinase At3g63330 [Asparagus officinalis]